MQEWSSATSLIIVFGYFVMICGYVLCVPSSIAIVFLVFKSIFKRKKSKKVIYEEDPH